MATWTSAIQKHTFTAKASVWVWTSICYSMMMITPTVIMRRMSQIRPATYDMLQPAVRNNAYQNLKFYYAKENLQCHTCCTAHLHWPAPLLHCRGDASTCQQQITLCNQSAQISSLSWEQSSHLANATDLITAPWVSAHLLKNLIQNYVKKFLDLHPDPEMDHHQNLNS